MRRVSLTALLSPQVQHLLALFILSCESDIVLGLGQGTGQRSPSYQSSPYGTQVPISVISLQILSWSVFLFAFLVEGAGRSIEKAKEDTFLLELVLEDMLALLYPTWAMAPSSWYRLSGPVFHRWKLRSREVAR
uniref:Uncharacterized protein n=1 Tax=Molossus molossus TaxID=27622 RepID=A0A7J8JX38_MOLMO|nr:hypothetical protein HJG59_007922 [Molossus molossus]